MVGGLITALEALLRQVGGQLLASIVGGLANFGWSVATFFVVPVIAFEDLGPRDAIRRSSGIVRERWGEGVTGSAAIGGVALLTATISAVFKVALFRFAADGSVLAGFERSELEAAFRPRRRR